MKPTVTVRFTRRVGTDATTFFRRGDTCVGVVLGNGDFQPSRAMKWPCRCNLTVFAGFFKVV